MTLNLSEGVVPIGHLGKGQSFLVVVFTEDLVVAQVIAITDAKPEQMDIIVIVTFRLTPMQAINLSVNKSINKSVSQSINQPVNIGRSICQTRYIVYLIWQVDMDAAESLSDTPSL